MLQNLYLYEIVLLITGGILFVALIIILFLYVAKGKSITSVLPFFFIAVIMIGWPTIKSVSFDNGKITVEKIADSLIRNPADTTLKKKLERTVADIDTTRAKNNPAALNAISKAYYALGNYGTASIYNNKALAINPSLRPADTLKNQIKNQIDLKRNFDKNIQALDANVRLAESGGNTVSSAVKENIVNTLNTIKQKQPVYADEQSGLVIAKALALVNKKEQAVQVANKVLDANPQSTATVQLKNDIATGNHKTLADSFLEKKVAAPAFRFVIRKAPIALK